MRKLIKYKAFVILCVSCRTTLEYYPPITGNTLYQSDLICRDVAPNSNFDYSQSPLRSTLINQYPTKDKVLYCKKRINTGGRKDASSIQVQDVTSCLDLANTMKTRVSVFHSNLKIKQKILARVKCMLFDADVPTLDSNDISEKPLTKISDCTNIEDGYREVRVFLLNEMDSDFVTGVCHGKEWQPCIF